MMARSKCSKSKAGYIDARPLTTQIDENLLLRAAGPYIGVIFDRVIELSLRANVRFDPESDQDRAATQYVAMGHCTKSLRDSPLRG